MFLYHLNLSGGVDDDELILLGPHQLQHLVKLGGEQVEAGDDAAVRAQLVLFHYCRKKILRVLLSFNRLSDEIYYRTNLNSPVLKRLVPVGTFLLPLKGNMNKQ